VALEDRLIIHLSETVTGAPDDCLDHATFLHCPAIPAWCGSTCRRRRFPAPATFSGVWRRRWALS